MKFILLLPLLCGCASFSSSQLETKPDGTRIESRQRINNFFQANTSVAKIRASTTEKTQGLTVGGFAAETDSSNVVSVIEAISKGAVEGAIKSMKP